jgi:hypothetical protein
MSRIRARMTYANVMATIAIFLVLGGGAYAAFHLPRNSVRSKNIVNKQVKRADLKPAEPFHRVGATGQPQLGNGGQNDCRWKRPPGGGQIAPPVFYKDPYGVVRMAGIAIGVNGPGGDATCDDSDDAIVFRLPAADRPARQAYFPPSVVIIGRRGLGPFPPGAVIATDLNPPQTVVPLDPVSFRAAGAGTGLGAKPSRLPTDTKLGRLLGLPN